MRWYYIKFTPKQGNQAPDILDFPLEYGTSEQSTNVFTPFGRNISTALEIEFDIERLGGGVVAPDTHLRIYNPPPSVVQNAYRYVGMLIEISAGFANYYGTGLPLANPLQSGVVGFGQVYASWANYVGADKALDIIIRPPSQGTPDTSLIDPSSSESINFYWKKGQTLNDALKNTFSIAPFNLKVEGTVREFNLDNDIVGGCYPDFNSFSSYLNQLTQALVNNSAYSGVDIVQSSLSSVLIYDNSKSSLDSMPIININKQDIIGQPTISFIDNQILVQSVHPMRADISRLGQRVQFPSFLDDRTIITQGAGIYGSGVSKTLLVSQVALPVVKIRNIGRFRDSSHQGWVTVLDSVLVNPYTG